MLVEEIRKERKQMYEQGRREAHLEIARAMRLKGLSLPLVIEVTGLPQEEIEKLPQATPHAELE